MASRRQQSSKSGKPVAGSEVSHTAGEYFGAAPGSNSESRSVDLRNVEAKNAQGKKSDQELDVELKSRRNEIYIRAVKLLARREHSYFELASKLYKAGFENDLVDVVLERLIDKGFLSDARFAELYVEQRFNKGYGERDIIANLARRGIDRQLASRALAEFVTGKNIDWYQHAFAVLSQRFKPSSVVQASAHLDEAVASGGGASMETAEDRRSLAREQAAETQRIRKRWGNFLMRRGFSNDQIISAIDTASAPSTRH